jgi:hypothetical protein
MPEKQTPPQNNPARAFFMTGMPEKQTPPQNNPARAFFITE